MAGTLFQDIKGGRRQLYLEDERPWLVGFSGGKDSTMLASLVFEHCALGVSGGSATVFVRSIPCEYVLNGVLFIIIFTIAE